MGKSEIRLHKRLRKTERIKNKDTDESQKKAKQALVMVLLAFGLQYVMKIFEKIRDLLYIRPLHKLNNKLVMASTGKNKFYEKYIRWQLSGAIEHLLYGEKTWKNSFKLIWKSRVMFISLILVAYGVFYTYHLGSSSRNSEISSLIASNQDKADMIESQNDIIYYNQSVVKNKDNTIDSLLQFKKSREWLEFKIYRETEMDDFYLNMSRVTDDILFLMASQADEYKIPYSIYFRLIDVESGYKFISNHGGSGAFGYMQVMPATFNSYAKKLNLKGGHTEKNNIFVGSYILYKNHIDWMNRGYDEHEAWEYTLAEYNAGEGKLQTMSGDKVVGWHIPRYTKSYIAEIMKTYNKKYR